MRTRPTTRRGAALALGAAALAVLTACSGSPAEQPSPQPSDQASSAAAPSTSPSPAASGTPSASASPSLQTLPVAECLTGTYRLVRFVGAGGETYGTGQGGDVSVRFSGDSYTVSGEGKEPMTLTLAGRTAQLRVDGKAEGTYALQGDTATFTQRSTSGSGTLSGAGETQRLSMEQVTRVVGLSGGGQVACTADAMTVTLQNVRLELVRS